MLKVWRGPRGFFAECTQCGSYGSPAGIEQKIKMEPEIEAAVERHTAHMMALRSSYTVGANNIINQINNGSLSRDDGTVKIREMWVNHVSQVRLAEAALPNPSGKVTTLAMTCPWCGVGEPIEIEDLPEDKTEPDWTLSRPVALPATKRGK